MALSGGARAGVLVVVQHAIVLGVGDDHEVRLAETLLAKALAELLEAHGHDGELLRLASLEVRLERALEVHVGDDVAAHEDEIRADDVAVVDQAHRLAGADAVCGDDGVHDEAGHGAPRALLDVLDDLLRVRAAEDEHLLDAVGGEELERVLDHRDVYEGKKRLGTLQGDGAESLREIEAGAGEGTSAIAQERDGGVGLNQSPRAVETRTGGART